MIGTNATTQQCPKPTTTSPPIHTRRVLDIKKELSELPDRSNVLLPTASQLNLDYTIPDIVKLVHSLRQSTKCRQLFVWASVKNVSDPKLIPFLEHMADIVVMLKDLKHLSVLTKKSTGSVSRKVRSVFFREIKANLMDLSPQFNYRTINTKFRAITRYR